MTETEAPPRPESGGAYVMVDGVLVRAPVEPEPAAATDAPAATAPVPVRRTRGAATPPTSEE